MIVFYSREGKEIDDAIPLVEGEDGVLDSPEINDDGDAFDKKEGEE